MTDCPSYDSGPPLLLLVVSDDLCPPLYFYFTLLIHTTIKQLASAASDIKREEYEDFQRGHPP